MNKKYYILSAVIFLVGCSSATPYQPLQSSFWGGTGGYSDYQLSSDTTKVTFKGNNLTSRDTVDNYLLYRAAEVTLANHYSYFEVLEKNEHVATSAKTQSTEAPLYEGSDITTTTEQTTVKQAYEITATIKMLSECQAPDYPNAYDARELIQYLEPHITHK